MRRKYTRDLTGVDIAVTGIPFDQAVSHRSGTRMGPEGIRKASAENAWGPFWPWNFDPFDTLAVIDYGDCFFDWGRKENFPQRLEDHATEIISSGAEMISLGRRSLRHLSAAQGPCEEARAPVARPFRCPPRRRAR